MKNRVKDGNFTARSLLASVVTAGALVLGVTSDSRAETFRWAFQGEVGTLDPHGLLETFTLGFQRNIYEPLVIRDDNMKLSPALAERWENVEPTVWRFHLRRGVKFHEGGDFAADDVAFSVERLRTKGSDMKVIARLIKGTNIIDDYTIDFITETPNPILPLRLEIFYIMDKQWSEKNNTTEATSLSDQNSVNYANLHANGTGPFILVSREPEVKTVLKRNPGWWGTMPGNVTDGIFTPIRQDATRVAALLSGEVDMVYPIPVQDWQRLESAKGVRPLTGPEARTIFLGFDQSRDELLYSNIKGKNPFKDIRVRTAFTQAIQIDAIRRKIMRGSATPAGLMVAPQINGFSQELNDKRPAFDVEAAKKLMKEAGYENGFELTMDCPNDRYVNDEKICQAVAAMLAKINVKVNLLAQTKAKYFGKVLAQNDYDTSFYLLGWTPNTFDSHNPISALLACREDGEGTYNLGGYCNPRINKLANIIESETDQDKRNNMIYEVFKIHQDEVGHIPLHHQPLAWGVSEKVEVVQRPDNVFDLRYARVNR